jgi:hypothetical protein
MAKILIVVAAVAGGALAGAGSAAADGYPGTGSAPAGYVGTGSTPVLLDSPWN